VGPCGHYGEVVFVGSCRIPSVGSSIPAGPVRPLSSDAYMPAPAAGLGMAPEIPDTMVRSYLTVSGTASTRAPLRVAARQVAPEKMRGWWSEARDYIGG
jgi:hypothetical protein